MLTPLMPKATAVWLIENTALTFQQIADFCNVHIIEVEAIANGDIASGMAPFDPVANNQLTLEEIDRCSKDPDARLVFKPMRDEFKKMQKKGGKYTPITKRENKPGAIAWILKHHPEIKDSHICRLLGTTKSTIEKIRNRTHKESGHIQARNPADVGLCSYQELATLIESCKIPEKSSE